MVPSLEDRLGPLQREHVSRTGVHRLLALSGWGAIAVALAASLLAVGRAWFAYETFGPLAVDRWASPPGVVAGVSLITGVVLLLLARGRGRKVVRQYARGLVILSGRRGSALPWDEVREIHTHSVRYGLGRRPWGRLGELTLVARDGQKLRLDQSLNEYDELAEAVKRAVYPPLLEAYTRAFNHGESLPFGPLSLTAEGIRNGRKTLRWEDLSQARLERGWLEAVPLDRHHGPKMRFPARAIPNVDLCLQLIQELTPNR